MGRNLSCVVSSISKILYRSENVLLKREELVSSNVNLVTGLEGSCDNALLGLDGEVDLVDGSKNLVDLADRSLENVLVANVVVMGVMSVAPYFVLEIDRGVEVRNLRIHGFANHLAFASMHDSSHL